LARMAPVFPGTERQVVRRINGRLLIITMAAVLTSGMSLR
jgi:hypothetical protein